MASLANEQVLNESNRSHPRILSAAVGFGHSCAVIQDDVKCWGNNLHGESNVPPGLKHPTQVAVGFAHTCAITDEGVKCWGDNDHGQISVPSGLKSPSQVTAGDNYNCALTADGIS